MSGMKKELIKELKANGFQFLRRGKHDQYHDGMTRITLPTGNGFDVRLYKMIRLQIRSAVRKRINVKL